MVLRGTWRRPWCRPTVEQLELPHTVWVVLQEPAPRVQPLAADSTPLGTPSRFRGSWGLPLGIVLHNDQASPDDELDARYLLGELRYVDTHEDGGWSALVSLEVLEPGRTAGQHLRARGRGQTRRPRRSETTLFSDEQGARRLEALYQSAAAVRGPAPRAPEEHTRRNGP